MPGPSLDTWNTWFSIGSNAVLAVSVIVGGALALQRWSVTFAFIEIDSPTYGEAFIDGRAQPKTTTWRCKLSLVAGPVAHIGRIKLQRRRGWFWVRVKQGSLPHVHMPISLSTDRSVDLYLSIERDSPGPYRLKIDEYSTLRSAELPFLEPDKKNDYA